MTCSRPTYFAVRMRNMSTILRLQASGIPLRLCSNTSNKTKIELAEILKQLGYDIDPSLVFPPAPAVCQYLKEKNLRPFMIIDPGVLPEFEGISLENPNCVVLGDALENFSYANVNKAFQVLIGLEKPVLIAMGRGRYYKDTDGLKLDVGVYAKALEYACDIEAEVIGKPAKSFFNAALSDMGVAAEHALMIGDDIVSDVGGAQACGMRALQVRTGKYRPQNEPHQTVTPDGYVDDLLQAVDLFLQHK